MGKAIEQRASEALGGEHAGPLVEGQVAGDDNRAALVALAEDIFRSSPPITASASPKSTCACPGSCRNGTNISRCRWRRSCT